MSIVVVVARLGVAGKWVRRAAKGCVLVAVKRRRSVRIVVSAHGEGVIVEHGPAMAFAVAVQCAVCSVASSVWASQVWGAAFHASKVKVRGVRGEALASLISRSALDDFTTARS